MGLSTPTLYERPIPNKARLITKEIRLASQAFSRAREMTRVRLKQEPTLILPEADTIRLSQDGAKTRTVILKAPSRFRPLLELSVE